METNLKDSKEAILEIINTSSNKLSFEKILIFIAMILVTMIAIHFIMKIITKFISKLPFQKTLHSFICSLIKFTLYFIASLIFAEYLGINVTSLIALFSVAGLAISLAIQGSLSNLAGGITTLITKPFLIGDFVEINNVSGTVKEINLIYTILSTIDNKLVFIPNSTIASNVIINYSSEKTRRIDLKICTSYDAKLDDVKNAINEAITITGGFLKSPAPLININNYGSSSIEYLIRIWVKSKDYWDNYYKLMENIKYSFESHNIEMTYDNLNVYVKK